MTRDDPAAIARRDYQALWNARRYETATELFHPDFAQDAAPGTRTAADKLATIREFHTSFPDFHITIDDLIASGDRVAARLTVTGTDTGGVHGLPPTGKPMRAWAVEHLGIRDGKIASNWVGADWLGLLIQLGTITSPWPH